MANGAGFDQAYFDQVYFDQGPSATTDLKIDSLLLGEQSSLFGIDLKLITLPSVLTHDATDIGES